MATYFDTTSDADIALLPSDVRSHSELANVADQAEAQILDKFRYDTGTEFKYSLNGANASDPARWQTEFASVMKRVIATVTAASLKEYDVTSTALKSESLDGYAYTRMEGTVTLGGSNPVKWPSGWYVPLMRFMTRKLHAL